MQKYPGKVLFSLILLLSLLIPGCDDLNKPTNKSNPNDLVKTWIITEFQIDEYNRDFSEGEITFTGTAFYGYVNKLDGIGSGEFSGDYTADENTLYLDVLSSTNEEMFMPGMKVAAYKADPSRAHFSYTSYYNTEVKIKLEY